MSLPVVMTDPERLRLAVKKVLANTAVAQASETSSTETDLVAVLDQVLKDAYLNRASDVHLLTEEDGLRVRFRVDGKLTDYPLDADQSVAAGLISRVKVLAGLDISEQRMPQDGGFSYQLAAPVDMEFNIRVATAPTRLGERITMRLLGSESSSLTLTDLGFLESDLEEFKQAIRKPYGMILLTGPTGSGKSTTFFHNESTGNAEESEFEDGAVFGQGDNGSHLAVVPTDVCNAEGAPLSIPTTTFSNATPTNNSLQNQYGDALEGDECHLLIALGFGGDAAASTTFSNVAIAQSPTYVRNTGDDDTEVNPEIHYSRYIGLFQAGVYEGDNGEVDGPNPSWKWNDNL